MRERNEGQTAQATPLSGIDCGEVTEGEGKELLAIVSHLEAGCAGLVRPLELTPVTPQGHLFGRALERVRADLRGMLTALEQVVRQSAIGVARSAVRLQQLTARIEEARREASAVATAIREVSNGVEEIAHAAEQAATAARAVDHRAAEGLQASQEAERAASTLRIQMDEVANQLQELLDQVAAITRVSEMIATIAKQTNLLALNAAIEAARAGEHGRGFAVVAEEVRRLAVSTQEAVTSIRQQVQALSEGMQRVGEAMGVVAEKVEQGALVASGGQEALTAIRKSVDTIVAPLQEIASAAEEQAQSVNQLAQNVQVVAEAAETVGRQASELTIGVIDQMQRLRAMREHIAQTTLSLADHHLVQVAKADHLLWVQRLLAMLHDRERLQPEQVADWTVCRLGRWYYGRGRERYGGSATFRALEVPHQRLHQTAAEAVRAWNSGQRDQARQLVEEVRRISQEIVQLLDSLRTH